MRFKHIRLKAIFADCVFTSSKNFFTLEWLCSFRLFFAGDIDPPYFFNKKRVKKRQLTLIKNIELQIKIL